MIRGGARGVASGLRIGSACQLPVRPIASRQSQSTISIDSPGLSWPDCIVMTIDLWSGVWAETALPSGGVTHKNPSADGSPSCGGASRNRSWW